MYAKQLVYAKQHMYAVQISLKDGTKYTFTSFMGRDTAFRCLFKVWQNSLMPEPLSAQHLIARASPCSCVLSAFHVKACRHYQGLAG